MNKHETRPTPETDEQNWIYRYPEYHEGAQKWVDADFARKLERERDEAREALNEERHNWQAERENAQARIEAYNEREELARMQTMAASVADIIAKRDAMLEAIRGANKFAFDILSNHECGIEIDIKCDLILAKLKPFLP